MSDRPDSHDPWDNEWEGFLLRLDGMIADGGYERDEEFLSGVRETVQRTRRVSDKQRNAVDDIEERVRGERPSRFRS